MLSTKSSLTSYSLTTTWTPKVHKQWMKPLSPPPTMSPDPTWRQCNRDGATQEAGQAPVILEVKLSFWPKETQPQEHEGIPLQSGRLHQILTNCRDWMWDSMRVQSLEELQLRDCNWGRVSTLLQAFLPGTSKAVWGGGGWRWIESERMQRSSWSQPPPLWSLAANQPKSIPY